MDQDSEGASLDWVGPLAHNVSKELAALLACDDEHNDVPDGAHPGVLVLAARARLT